MPESFITTSMFASFDGPEGSFVTSAGQLPQGFLSLIVLCPTCKQMLE